MNNMIVDTNGQSPSTGGGGAETSDFNAALIAAGSSVPSTGGQGPGQLSSKLDGLRYIASHQDLADAFGADADEGLTHFETFGHAEERAVTFDPAAYLARRPHVRAHYEAQGLSGASLHEAATRHFIERGRYELAGAAVPGTFGQALFESLGQSTFGSYDGQAPTGSNQLEGLRYIASHQSLADSFGLDWEAGLAHYEAEGAEAGLEVIFDPQTYMQRLPNVRDHYEAQGYAGEALEIKATEHFLNHGRYTLAGLEQPPAAAGSAASEPVVPEIPDVALPTDPHAAVLAAAQGGPIDLAQAYAPETELDGLRYVASYSDLADAFGADGAAGLQHAAGASTTENRGVLFDPEAYLDANSGVRTFFEAQGLEGDALFTAATAHFINQGRFEIAGAPVPGTFEVALYEVTGGEVEPSVADAPPETDLEILSYIASYGDLATSFGADVAAGRDHFENHGHAEGRHISFSAEAYGERMPDVLAHYQAQGLEGEALDTALVTHFLEHGQYFLSGRPEPVVPVDVDIGDTATTGFSDGQGALGTWFTLGLISEEQYDRYVGDAELVAGLDAAVAGGSGVAEGVSAAEVALNEIIDGAESSIEGILARGFDLAAGPDADQLAALHLLSKGDSVAFFELATNWAMGQHPDLQLLLTPPPDDSGNEEATLTFASESVPGVAEVPFFQHLVGRMTPGDLVENLSYDRTPRVNSRHAPRDNDDSESTNTNRPIGHTGIGGGVEAYDRGTYSIAPTLERTHEIYTEELDWTQSTSAESKKRWLGDIVGFDGPTRVYTLNGQDYDYHTGFNQDARGIEATFSARDNYIGKHWDDGLGQSFQNALEATHPDLLTGTTTILYNTDGAVVESNPDQIGNHEILNIGGTDTQVDLSGVNNTLVTEVLTSGTTITGGGGDAVIYAQDVTDITLTDTDLTHGNITQTVLAGDNSGADITTDGADNVVAIGAGVTEDLTLEAEGDTTLAVTSGAALTDADINFDGVESETIVQGDASIVGATIIGGDEDDSLTLESGAVVADTLFVGGDEDDSLTLQSGATFVDSRFSGDDDEDTIEAQAGSLLDNAELDLGDDDDVIMLAGEVVGSRVELGDGSDYLQIQQTFEGDFDLSDSAASWMWAGETEIHEQDIVELQGEGWELTETPDGPKLIARDADGSILGQINMDGNSEYIESIYTVDAAGNVSSLQNIEPEVRTKLAAFGFLSQVLLAVGVVFPPAAAVGATLKFAYDASNNQLSLKNGLLTTAQVLAAGSASLGPSGLTANSSLFYAPAITEFGFNIAEGDLLAAGSGALLTAAGVSEVANGVQAGSSLLSSIGQGVQATFLTASAIESGNPFEIVSGVSLLGLSVAPSGAPQLLLGVTNGAAQSADAIFTDGDFLGGLAGALETGLSTGLFDNLAPEILAAGFSAEEVAGIVGQLTSDNPDGQAIGNNVLSLLGNFGVEIDNSNMSTTSADGSEVVTNVGGAPGQDANVDATAGTLETLDGVTTTGATGEPGADEISGPAPLTPIDLSDVEDPFLGLETAEIGTANFDADPFASAQPDGADPLEFENIALSETDDTFDFGTPTGTDGLDFDPSDLAPGGTETPEQEIALTNPEGELTTPYDPESTPGFRSDFADPEADFDLLTGGSGFPADTSGATSIGLSDLAGSAIPATLPDDAITFDLSSVDLSTEVGVLGPSDNPAVLPLLTANSEYLQIAGSQYTVGVQYDPDNNQSLVTYRINGTDHQLLIRGGDEAAVAANLESALVGGFLEGLTHDGPAFLPSEEIADGTLFTEADGFSLSENNPIDAFNPLSGALPELAPENEVTGTDAQRVGDLQRTYALVRNGSQEDRDALLEGLNNATTNEALDAEVLNLIDAVGANGLAWIASLDANVATVDSGLGLGFDIEDDTEVEGLSDQIAGSINRLYEAGAIDSTNFGYAPQGYTWSDLGTSASGIYNSILEWNVGGVVDGVAEIGGVEATEIGADSTLNDLIQSVDNPAFQAEFADTRTNFEISEAPAEYQGLLVEAANKSTYSVEELHGFSDSQRLGVLTLDQEQASEITQIDGNIEQAGAISEVIWDGFVAGLNDVFPNTPQETLDYFEALIKEEGIETLIPLFEGIEKVQIAGSAAYHTAGVVTNVASIDTAGAPEDTLLSLNGASGHARGLGQVAANMLLSRGVNAGTQSITTGAQGLVTEFNNLSNQNIPQSSQAAFETAAATTDDLTNIEFATPPDALQRTAPDGQTYEIVETDAGFDAIGANGASFALPGTDLAAANDALTDIFNGAEAPAATNIDLGGTPGQIIRSVENGANVYDLQYTTSDGQSYTTRLEGGIIEDAQANALDTLGAGGLTGLGTANLAPVTLEPFTPDQLDPSISDISSIPAADQTNPTQPIITPAEPGDFASPGSEAALGDLSSGSGVENGDLSSLTIPSRLSEADGLETNDGLASESDDLFNTNRADPDAAVDFTGDITGTGSGTDTQTFVDPLTGQEVQYSVDPSVVFEPTNPDASVDDGTTVADDSVDPADIDTDTAEPDARGTMAGFDPADFNVDSFQAELTPPDGQAILEQMEEMDVVEQIRSTADPDFNLIDIPYAVSPEAYFAPTTISEAASEFQSRNGLENVLFEGIPWHDGLSHLFQNANEVQASTPFTFLVDRSLRDVVESGAPMTDAQIAGVIETNAERLAFPIDDAAYLFSQLQHNASLNGMSVNEFILSAADPSTHSDLIVQRPRAVPLSTHPYGVEWLKFTDPDLYFAASADSSSNTEPAETTNTETPEVTTTDGNQESGSTYEPELRDPLVYNPEKSTLYANLALIDQVNLDDLPISPASEQQQSVVTALANTEAGQRFRDLLGVPFASLDEATEVVANAQRDLAHEARGDSLANEVETAVFIFERDGAYVVGESLAIGDRNSTRRPQFQNSMAGTSEIRIVHPHPEQGNEFTRNGERVLDHSRQTIISIPDRSEAETLLRGLVNSGQLPNLRDVSVTSINSLTGELTTFTNSADGSVNVTFQPTDLDGRPIRDEIIVGGVRFNPFEVLDEATMDIIGATSGDSTQTIKNKFYDFFYNLDPSEVQTLEQFDFTETVVAPEALGIDVGLDVEGFGALLPGGEDGSLETPVSTQQNAQSAEQATPEGAEQPPTDNAIAEAFAGLENAASGTGGQGTSLDDGADVNATDIESTSPYPDFNAVLGGDGRDWTETEIQAIRDYRAANDGTLPDGVTVGDLPTVLVEEIAGLRPPATPGSDAPLRTIDGTTYVFDTDATEALRNGDVSPDGAELSPEYVVTPDQFVWRPLNGTIEGFAPESFSDKPLVYAGGIDPENSSFPTSDPIIPEPTPEERAEAVENAVFPTEENFDPDAFPDVQSAREYFQPLTLAEAEQEFMARSGNPDPFIIQHHDGFSHLLQSADEASDLRHFTDYVDDVIESTEGFDPAAFEQDLIASAQSLAETSDYDVSTAEFLIDQLRHNAALNDLSLAEFTEKLRTGQDFDTLLVQRPRAVPLDSAPVLDVPDVPANFPPNLLFNPGLPLSAEQTSAWQGRMEALGLSESARDFIMLNLNGGSVSPAEGINAIADMVAETQSSFQAAEAFFNLNQATFNIDRVDVSLAVIEAAQQGGGLELAQQILEERFGDDNTEANDPVDPDPNGTPPVDQNTDPETEGNTPGEPPNDPPGGNVALADPGDNDGVDPSLLPSGGAFVPLVVAEGEMGDATNILLENRADNLSVFGAGPYDIAVPVSGGRVLQYTDLTLEEAVALAETTAAGIDGLSAMDILVNANGIIPPGFDQLNRQSEVSITDPQIGLPQEVWPSGAFPAAQQLTPEQIDNVIALLQEQGGYRDRLAEPLLRPVLEQISEGQANEGLYQGIADYFYQDNLAKTERAMHTAAADGDVVGLFKSNRVGLQAVDGPHRFSQTRIAPDGTSYADNFTLIGTVQQDGAFLGPYMALYDAISANAGDYSVLEETAPGQWQARSFDTEQARVAAVQAVLDGTDQDSAISLGDGSGATNDWLYRWNPARREADTELRNMQVLQGQENPVAFVGIPPAVTLENLTDNLQTAEDLILFGDNYENGSAEKGVVALLGANVRALLMGTDRSQASNTLSWAVSVAASGEVVLGNATQPPNGAFFDLNLPPLTMRPEDALRLQFQHTPLVDATSGQTYTQAEIDQAITVVIDDMRTNAPELYREVFGDDGPAAGPDGDPTDPDGGLPSDGDGDAADPTDPPVDPEVPDVEAGGDDGTPPSDPPGSSAAPADPDEGGDNDVALGVAQVRLFAETTGLSGALVDDMLSAVQMGDLIAADAISILQRFVVDGPSTTEGVYGPDLVEPAQSPFDVTTIDPEGASVNALDIDLASMQFDDGSAAGAEIVLDDSTAPLFAPDIFPAALTGPLQPGAIAEPNFNSGDLTQLTWRDRVLNLAYGTFYGAHDVVLEGLEAFGKELSEYPAFQWLLDLGPMGSRYRSFDPEVDSAGNATVDVDGSLDLLDILADHRIDPRLALSFGKSAAIAGGTSLFNGAVFFDARTIKILRRNLPDIMNALGNGDVAEVRRMITEAVGLAGDLGQGVLDPRLTKNLFDEIPLGQIGEIAVDEFLQTANIAPSGYFLFKTNTLNGSEAFEERPGGGWQLAGREITAAELAAGTLNMIGEPAKPGDYVLDVDLPIDEAALQLSLGPLFIHQEYGRSDLEASGLTLTIPAGTPIPRSIYNVINGRLQTQMNIATWSPPGVAYTNSQRIYVRARDFELRTDKLTDQPFTRDFVGRSLLHLNGLDDWAYLSTGDLATASADILSIRSPAAFSVPLVGSVRVSLSVYQRSRAPKSPDEVAPLNYAIELAPTGSEQAALNIPSAVRLAALAIDDTDPHKSIQIETVNIAEQLNLAQADTSTGEGGGVSVIALKTASGEIAYAAVPDTLVSLLEGAPLSAEAGDELAVLLGLYAASPDDEVRRDVQTALENLANEEPGAAVSLPTLISVAQVLETAALRNRLVELPDLESNTDDNAP